MIGATYKNQQRNEADRIKRPSGFISKFKQILEDGKAQNSQVEQLLLFQRSEQRKSLDQLADNEITALIQNFQSPILIIPPNDRTTAIDRVCFIGNVEGLSDHPLLHQIIAHFLPSPHRIDNKGMTPIHWNNVFQIPVGIPIKHQLLPRQLNQMFSEAGINIAILPIPHGRPWWRSLWEISFLWKSNIPVLVIPV